MTTQLQMQVADLSNALVTLIGKFKELEASVNNSSQAYNAQSPMMPTAMQQVPPPMQSDAPQIKVKVALWEKSNSLSGALTISDMSAGGQAIAELRLMLYMSNPNDRGLVMNGYILSKDQSAPGTKVSDAAIGSAFVTKNGTLQMELNLTATPVYNNLKVNLELQPNASRTNENQPILNAEIIVQHHFYTDATRAQIAAAGVGQQQPQQQQQQPQNTLSSLLSSPGQPSDFGVLTGQLQQPSMEQPTLSVLDYLK